METQVEELPENRVRLTVEVPVADVQHAVEHAASDLAGSLKVPGFRKGKVPLPVLFARVGKQRVYTEAVESHIGGWFRNAAVSSRIRPVSRPEYEYDVPTSPDEKFSFTATVDVQPKIEPPDWTTLEVPAAEPDLPAELVEQQLNALRESVAELAPADRPAAEGDTVVADLVNPSGEAQRDYVVELGSGRLVEEIEGAILGMSPGETKEVEYELADDSTASVSITLKEVKEKVLPPLDDELARATSEFDALADLRADIESRLREQLEDELAAEFRSATVEALVRAANVSPSPELVRQRASGLLGELMQSLERRGITFETYLAVTNQTTEQVQERLVAQAAGSLAGELALEAVADKLGIEVSDEEIAEVLREQEENEDTIRQVLESSLAARIRDDLRLRRALDRVVGEVKRIPVDLARARDKLWTPEKEKGPADTKIWTPGQGGATS